MASMRSLLLGGLASLLAVTLVAAVSPRLGIAQPPSVNRIADENDTAATLSGSLPSDWFNQLAAMPNLRKLTVRNPNLQSLKLTRLGELKNLTEFSAEDFSMDSRLADIVAVNIARLPHLKSVQFRRTGLTGRGLQALSRSTLSELVLEGEEYLQDGDLRHLANLPSLKVLVLDSTPIDMEGLNALQEVRGLRRLVLRRHPAGTIEKGVKARVKTIALLTKLEELELDDTGYSDLHPLKANKSLRLLTLRNCGSAGAWDALKELNQLKRVEMDDCDLSDTSFEDLKVRLAELGILLTDNTQYDSNVTRHAETPDEPTQFARKALEQLNVGKHFPAFWISWNNQSYKIPSMKAERVRSVHRLKQTLTAGHEEQPWREQKQFAYAPEQFFVRDRSLNDNDATWERIAFGDRRLARIREGSPNDPRYFLQSGVKQFEHALGHMIPHQVRVTHQHLWWDTPTGYQLTSSPVSPERTAYIELPEEKFADETCRVFQGPGRSERLWVSKATGRLRGCLHYIHQGYFTPFFKLDVVTSIAGRKIGSNEEYAELFTGPNRLAKELQSRLWQAWAEHKFPHAYPDNLFVFHDHRELSPGQWFPFKVSLSGWLHNQENQGQYDYHLSECVVTEVALDRHDLEPYWSEFLPTIGVRIQDQRFGRAVDYPFDPDRTDDVVQVMIHESMLKQARENAEVERFKFPFADMLGKPAPRLPNEGWVGTPPDVTGKRYLIHFWATWCGPCKNDVPLLNSLATNRIVIGVHPGDTPIDKIGETIESRKMNYPTVVAPKAAPDLLGYPAKMFPYCVEVDEKGNVARHGFLEEVLGFKDRPVGVADQLPQAQGTILALDMKNTLAVVSLGEEDGVEEKQLLNVEQEGKSVAQLRVVSIYQNKCVGKITDEMSPGTVEKGDKVVSFATSPSESTPPQKRPAAQK